jgi:hypothetical protein
MRHRVNPCSRQDCAAHGHVDVRSSTQQDDSFSDITASCSSFRHSLPTTVWPQSALWRTQRTACSFRFRVLVLRSLHLAAPATLPAHPDKNQGQPVFLAARHDICKGIDHTAEKALIVNGSFLFACNPMCTVSRFESFHTPFLPGLTRYAATATIQPACLLTYAFTGSLHFLIVSLFVQVLVVFVLLGLNWI